MTVFVTSHCMYDRARHIAIDGKTLKGSRRLDAKALHVLSAFATDLSAVIGDHVVEPGQNEITAAMVLLKGSPLDGAIAIDDYLADFAGRPGQVGVIYRIGGVLAGLDLFGSERTFARALPKLVRGAALQALAGYEKDGRPSVEELPFLRSALTAPTDRFPAVGLGEELRIDIDARVNADTCTRSVWRCSAPPPMASVRSSGAAT